MTDIKELFLKVIIGSKTTQNNIFSFYFFLEYILKFININFLVHHSSLISCYCCCCSYIVFQALIGIENPTFTPLRKTPRQDDKMFLFLSFSFFTAGKNN